MTDGFDYVQVNYDQYLGDAYEGMIADISFKQTQSYSAVGPLRYGSAVSLPALNADRSRQVTRFNLENPDFRGIVIREHVREGELTALSGDDGDGETSYVPDKSTASVLTAGRIWVKVQADVTAGDPVHALPIGPEGGFSNTGGTAIPSAIFTTNALAGELAIAELR